MIGWFIRHLPGPAWVRATIFVLLVAAAVVYLFGWGFEALSTRLPALDGPGMPVEAPTG